MMFKRTIYAFWGSFDTSVIATVRRTDWQKYIFEQTDDNVIQKCTTDVA